MILCVKSTYSFGKASNTLYLHANQVASTNIISSFLYLQMYTSSFPSLTTAILATLFCTQDHDNPVCITFSPSGKASNPTYLDRCILLLFLTLPIILLIYMNLCITLVLLVERPLVCT